MTERQKLDQEPKVAPWPNEQGDAADPDAEAEEPGAREREEKLKQAPLHLPPD